MLKKAIKGLRNAELIIAGTLFCAALVSSAFRSQIGRAHV